MLGGLTTIDTVLNLHDVRILNYMLGNFNLLVQKQRDSRSCVAFTNTYPTKEYLNIHIFGSSPRKN